MKALDAEPVWSLVAGVGLPVKAGLFLLSSFAIIHPLTPAQDLAVDGFMAVTIAWLLRARVAPTTGTQDGTTIYPAGSVKQDAQNAKKDI